MNELTELTVAKQESGIFRIAYDGRILGDSKGYSTRAECISAIDMEIAIDSRDAIRFARPVIYIKG